MSSFFLKIIACFFMLIDHIGLMFFPKVEILRAIGRLAMPIFAFQASIGFEKSNNKKKYIIRMLIFTIASQIPFYFFRKLALANPSPELNIGASLTIGLLVLYCLEEIKNPIVKIISVIPIILISVFIPMDYGWFCIALMILFYYTNNHKIAMAILYTALLSFYCYIKQSLFGLPTVYALVPIMLYNNQKGKDVKRIFYFFYPIHLLVLTIIECYLILHVY